MFTSTPGVVRMHFWTNSRTQVFGENHFFFLFCGALKHFFTPKTFVGLRNPHPSKTYRIFFIDCDTGFDYKNLQKLLSDVVLGLK